MTIKKVVICLFAAGLVIISGCNDDEATVKAPELATAEVSDITASTAIAGGTITDAGTPAYTERGVCYGTTSNPTVSDTKVADDGTGTGSFTTDLTDLTAETTYYVRAYATTSNGTAYGNEVSFTTLEDTPPEEE